MACTLTPNSLRVQGHIGQYSVMILIDTRATHNFISHTVAVMKECSLRECPTSEVMMGDSMRVPCNPVFEEVDDQVQETHF
uniref:Aspartic peptidase DDI1-type domain-containing protein n=1 Tax=Nymphaea colorata TaxID=210225 RepID=A0A5K1DJE8_9MAGN